MCIYTIKCRGSDTNLKFKSHGYVEGTWFPPSGLFNIGMFFGLLSKAGLLVSNQRNKGPRVI